MSLEDDATSDLPELTPIISNQHVKKVDQNYAITIVDNSVNVSLKTPTEHQAAMSLNIDKLTNTFSDQLTNLTFILKDNVNVEQTSRGSSSIVQSSAPAHQRDADKISIPDEGETNRNLKAL